MARHSEYLVGQQFGEYHLIRLLGRGNFGVVYLGEHITNKSLAAIKVLRGHLRSPERLREFLNEARSFRLSHPHIVQLLDFGVRDGDDIPYLVMEYAPGGTLRQRHPLGKRLQLSFIIPYVRQIAEALQHAHNHNVIHRDVKPANILLNDKNELLLSDFGIAAVGHRIHTQQTRDQAGTLPYMAPEQLQGHPQIASDQYALGIIVYQWLCGELPFNGSPIEIGAQHMKAPPPSLCQKLPDLAPEVERVIVKALAKDPCERFESVRHFAEALEEAARSTQTVGMTLLIYNEHSDEVRSVAWSPDGKYLASGSLDKTLRVWTSIQKEEKAVSRNGQTIVSYQNHSGGINAVAWAPDGTRIASASLDGSVQVWDILTGSLWLTYREHSNWVRAVAWSPDGKYLASGSGDRTVQVWDATSGKLLYTYTGHESEVRGVVWSSDGRYLASCSMDRTVQVWSPNGNHRGSAAIIIYPEHTKGICMVAWSPDGHQIASCSLDDSVHIWNVSTGTCLLIYRGHADSVNTLSWSPDGKYIASGARDKLVLIWNPETGRTHHSYASHSGWITTLAWSPDSRYLASGSLDQTIHVWRAV